MTHVDQRDKGTAAAAGFVAFLTLAAGGVGLVIAALAVGCEHAWRNWRGTRGPGGGWDRHVGDQRAWLDADRARLDGWRAKRRDWWAAGADPATEPVRPARSSGFGGWARRAWATVAVFAERVRAAAAAFWRGARTGWRFARKVRDAGGTWWDTARARPEPDPEPAPEPAAGQPDDEPEPEPEPQTRQPDPEPLPGPQPDPAPRTQPDPHSQPDQHASAEGETVTTTTQGETNLDYTAADLAGIQEELTAIEEHNDALAARRNALQAKLATAQERVDRTGGTTATAAALDAARSVADHLGQQISGVADSTAEAADATQAAHAGLAPARDAQDTLQASGARGEFVDTATSD